MTFKPGQSGNPAGRKKGSQNRSTRALKEALLRAGDRAGGVDADGNPRGVEGWLIELASSDPKAFASLLGRLLPTEQRISGDGPTLVLRDYSGGKSPAQGPEAATAAPDSLEPPDVSEQTPPPPKNGNDVTSCSPSSKIN